MNSNKNSGVDTKEEIFLMLTTPSCSLDDGRIFKKIRVYVLNVCMHKSQVSQHYV